MPGSYCAIFSCKADSSKCSNVLTFHQLPKRGKNDEWRAALINKINRSDKLFNPDRARICSRHFTESCFKYGATGQGRLIQGSLPTEFMPQRSIETPKAPARHIYIYGLPKKKRAVRVMRPDLSTDGAQGVADELQQAPNTTPEISATRMPLISTQRTARKRRASLSRKLKRKAASDGNRVGRSLIDIGKELSRWCQLTEELGLASNETLAGILLDLYYTQQQHASDYDGDIVSTPSARPLALYKVTRENVLSSRSQHRNPDATDPHESMLIGEVKVETDVAEEPLLSNHTSGQHQLSCIPESVKTEVHVENSVGLLAAEENPTGQTEPSPYHEVWMKQETEDNQ